MPDVEVAGASPTPAAPDQVRYPHECTATVALADGTLATVRAIRPEDNERLQAFHDQLSEETIYRRFFGTHPHLRPEEAERFTHVDYWDRLALVTEVEDRLVAVARYDRPPGRDRAEVAFVVADELQGRGVGTLLLEHLAAAARRRGVAAFIAETLGTNHPMQEVFHRSGFPTRLSFSSGVAQVDFRIAPTDAYLEAVLERDAWAMHARLRPAVAPAGSGPVGIISQSASGASALAEACGRLGLELSSVLVAETLATDSAGALAYLAADDATRVGLLHGELVGPPARLVAHGRALARRKPLLAIGSEAWSANLCEQAGIELAGDLEALPRWAAERLAQLDEGTWRPPARGALPELDGCNIGLARAVLDRDSVSVEQSRVANRPSASTGRLDDSAVADLLTAYGLISPGGGAGAPTMLSVTIDDEGGSSATARATRAVGQVLRMLPLTDRDAVDLVGTGVVGDEPRGLDSVLRLARMLDDQPDVCRIEVAIGDQGDLNEVRIWTAAVRDRLDDPFVRRLPMEARTGRAEP
jgi:GNAT superfamily N-acetyltransferase